MDISINENLKNLKELFNFFDFLNHEVHLIHWYSSGSLFDTVHEQAHRLIWKTEEDRDVLAEYLVSKRVFPLVEDYHLESLITENMPMESFIPVMEKYGSILLEALQEAYDSENGSDVDSIAIQNILQDMIEKYYKEFEYKNKRRRN